MRCGFEHPTAPELCVFRDSEWPSFSILPLCSVAKSFILQPLQNGPGNCRYETTVKIFCEDLSLSSDYSSILFSKEQMNLKFLSDIPDNGETYSLVPRVPCTQIRRPVPKPASKPKVTIQSSMESSGKSQQSAAKTPDQRSSTAVESNSKPSHVAISSKCSGSSVTAVQKQPEATNVSATLCASKQVLTNHTQPSSLQDEAKKQAMTCSKQSEPADVPVVAAMDAVSVQLPSAAAKDNAKKRKDPPASAGGDDLSPAHWEALVRDGGIQKTTVPAMKLFLASVKLPVSGKKEVLIERIRKHFKL